MITDKMWKIDDVISEIKVYDPQCYVISNQTIHVHLLGILVAVDFRCNYRFVVDDVDNGHPDSDVVVAVYFTSNCPSWKSAEYKLGSAYRMTIETTIVDKLQCILDMLRNQTYSDVLRWCVGILSDTNRRMVEEDPIGILSMGNDKYGSSVASVMREYARTLI